jgi:putative oxidoreductase
MSSENESSPLVRFLSTDANRALLVQRVALGLVMLPHGAQKLLGSFGGYGFSGTMGFFTGTMHIPAFAAFLVIVEEFFGAIGLVLGAGTRLAASGIVLIMLGAIFTTHLHVGFFMNWFGTQGGEGFEFHLLAIALALPLAIWGGGELSVDRAVVGVLSRAPRGREVGRAHAN